MNAHRLRLPQPDYFGAGEPDETAWSLARTFEEFFGRPPVAVGRAPGRVNLIGEHTDYNRGRVLPLAILQSTFSAAAPRRDGCVRVASLQKKESWEGSLREVGPGSVKGWPAYVVGVLWAMGEAGIGVAGMDLLVDGQVPLGAGLSSSAALECSVAVVAAAIAGEQLTLAMRQLLARACTRAEIEMAEAPTGGMDQTVSLLAESGAALLIDFDTNEARPISLDLDGMTLLVTDTRVSHQLTDGGYAARRADCEAAARALGVSSLREVALDDLVLIDDQRTRRRARHIVTEIGHVDDVVRALESCDWAALGQAFRDSHASMRDDFEISCPELDVAVTAAVEAGAIAARMTGGGFGGSAIAIVPDERVEAATRAITSAFARRGFRSPVHLQAVPASGASLHCLAAQSGGLSGGSHDRLPG